MPEFKLSLAGDGRAWHGKMCITTLVLGNESETLCSLNILFLSLLSLNDGVQS
jgi:hypothetical protein